MAFALVRCPNCGAMLDFSNAGKMREKYGPKIGEKRTITCFKCSTQILVQSEWTQMPIAQKTKYLGRNIFYIVMGGIFTYIFFFPSAGNSTNIDLPLMLIGLTLGIAPIVIGILELLKIESSIRRTRQS